MRRIRSSSSRVALSCEMNSTSRKGLNRCLFSGPRTGHPVNASLGRTHAFDG
jgi:hypothetical protein